MAARKYMRCGDAYRGSPLPDQNKIYARLKSIQQEKPFFWDGTHSSAYPEQIIMLHDLQCQAHARSLLDLERDLRELQHLLLKGTEESVHVAKQILMKDTYSSGDFESLLVSYIRSLQLVFDPEASQRLIRDKQFSDMAWRMLAPRSNFDAFYCLKVEEQEKIIAQPFVAICHQHNIDRENARCKLRTPESMEPGFTEVCRKLERTNSSDSARLYGNDLVDAGQFFSAEAAYMKAASFNSRDPRIWTNLSLVRRKIGQRARAETAAMARLQGAPSLYLAVRNAQKSIEVDPCWVRGYIRHAEALEALGDDNLGMACRVLLNGLVHCRKQCVENPHPKHAVSLMKLCPKRNKQTNTHGQEEAQIKQHLTRMQALGSMWAKAEASLRSVDEELSRALDKLKGLSLEWSADVNAICETLTWVESLLRLQYQNPLKFKPLSRALLTQVRCTLYHCGQIVPLEYLKVEKFRKLVLERQCHTCRHADRGMRLHNIMEVISDSDSGSEHDEEENAFSCPAEGRMSTKEELKEMAMRGQWHWMDPTLMDKPKQHMLASVLPSVVNRGETKYYEDVSVRHAFAFALPILCRMAMHGEHRSLAADRISKLALSKRGQDCGGEFLSLATHIFCGVASWRIGKNQSNQLSVVDGGKLPVIVAEISNGGDRTGGMQKMLAKVTVAQWQSQRVHVVEAVLQNYIFVGIERASTMLKHTFVDKHALQTLAHIFESEPSVEAHLTGEDHFKTIENQQRAHAIISAVTDSSFGQFVIRRYASERHDSCLERLMSLTSKWTKMTSAEKAGYRWETLPKALQSKLIQLGRVVGPQRADSIDHVSSSGVNFAAVEIRHCRVCKKEDGPLVKLRKCGRCFSVYYCSKEHLNEDWPVHKAVCSQARSTMCDQ